jgi:hypothetical protein
MMLAGLIIWILLLIVTLNSTILIPIIWLGFIITLQILFMKRNAEPFTPKFYKIAPVYETLQIIFVILAIILIGLIFSFWIK